jgi:hypothetical protein
MVTGRDLGPECVAAPQPRLQDRQPVFATCETTEHDGVLFDIEVCVEVVAWLGWRERSWDRQTSLGIKGDHHSGIIPPPVPRVTSTALAPTVRRVTAA